MPLGDRKRVKKQVSWRMERADWEEKAQAAFDSYIAALKRDLGPNANFAEMERAIMKHSPDIMRSTLEGLANSEDFSPSKKRET